MVGPFLTQEERAEIAAEITAAWPTSRLLRRAYAHITAADDTIRTQNAERARLEGIVARWRVELDVSDPEAVVVVARDEHEELIVQLCQMEAERDEARVQLRSRRDDTLADNPER